MAAGLPMVDVRSPQEYTGEKLHMPDYPQEGTLRGGHIPGALNRPWSGACDQAGRFLDADAQRERWRATGNDPVVVYCGSGVTACVNLFSRALAGFSGDRLYPGSWSDWSARKDAPVATGPEPG